MANLKGGGGRTKDPEPLFCVCELILHSIDICEPKCSHWLNMQTPGKLTRKAEVPSVLSIVDVVGKVWAAEALPLAQWPGQVS